MNIAQIETKLTELTKDFNKKSFIFDLLIAYGIPKNTIALLKKGNRNLSSSDDKIILKKKLYFQEVYDQDLHDVIDDLCNDKTTFRYEPRFIIVTDYKTLLAVDVKTDDTLDIDIKNINKYFDFFLPWAGMEKAQLKSENPADIKAAEKMAKLYDEILKDNHFKSKEDLHRLNNFLSRLLFCYFAEDTGIFSSGIFTLSVSSYTQPDGSDLNIYLNKLFEFLNTKNNERTKYPKYLQNFPYVNGGLFGDKYYSPKFTRKSRDMIIECGELDWSAINPDIFGSMIQAVVHTEQRGGMGIHYTSVPNIMKVIEPLFLNDLREEFERYSDNSSKLLQLLARLEKIIIFDPACGSGNFLIISYKEIRKLEIEIFKRIKEINRQFPLAQSCISLSNFYGIELDDFAHEVAILSLWLAEHQMNVLFQETFGEVSPTLPLKDSGNIHCGNATRLDWKKVCPKANNSEIYLLGNPPYLGFLQQSKEQKEDMDIVFEGIHTIKKLDYISCWFYKGSRYIRDSGAKLAFVSTNSLCQGEQVALLWPHILTDGIEIYFAHHSFKWTNNAKRNAGVTCIIIGLRNESNKPKYIYDNTTKLKVENINSYLSPTKDLYVIKHLKPISDLPPISLGSSAYDGGHLMLSKEEYKKIIGKFPAAKKMIRRFVGSAEFLRGIERYCIWIPEKLVDDSWNIPPIAEKLKKVKEFRKTSNRIQTRETISTPYAFTENRHVEKPSIIIPIVSSERRNYYVCGFLKGSEIIANSARAIYDPDPYIFGILSSRMHMLWIQSVAGRLKTDYRYSAGICYNGFPFPEITTKQKETITSHVYNILEERESYTEMTLAEMYDPDKMPKSLLHAHQCLDHCIESCYRSKIFKDDTERLEYLFKLYEVMSL